MYFFVGLHQPSDARYFKRSFISVNRLRKRKSEFEVSEWIMDSGAFTEVSRHGGYRHPVREYADQIDRWSDNGRMLAAVSQDYMCEPFILAKTGLSVQDHQRMTIERYDELQQCVTCCYIMPVLQGYRPEGYLRHLESYGNRIGKGAWVGVGSICKRNSSPDIIHEILLGIKRERPDLRLHGFGLKATSLYDPQIRQLLYSADSMAWSFAARMEGRDANDWREAKQFENHILKGDQMSDKHMLEQLRDHFLSGLSELEFDNSPAVHNDVLGRLDRSIAQVLMGVESNHAEKSAPKAKPGLTRGQKIAQSRARNKKKREAEAAAQTSAEDEAV